MTLIEHYCCYDTAAGLYDGHPHFFFGSTHMAACRKVAEFAVKSYHYVPEHGLVEYDDPIWACAEHYELHEKWLRGNPLKKL